MEDTTNASFQDSAAAATAEIAATQTEADSTSSVDQGQVQSTETQTSVPAEQSFFDPNAVPEELKPAYKQMQADYTKKTQELAVERKQLSEAAAKAEKYAKYENFLPVFEEMLSPTQKQNESPEIIAYAENLKKQGYSDEAVDLAKQTASFLMQNVNQTLTAKEQQAQQEAANVKWAQEIEAAKTLDPRLSDESLVYETEGGKMSFGEIVEGITMAQKDFRENLQGATKRAIAIVDAMVGKAKSEGKAELSASATSKAAKFPDISTSPQGTEPTEKHYSSMREAAQDAQAKMK